MLVNLSTATNPLKQACELRKCWQAAEYDLSIVWTKNSGTTQYYDIIQQQNMHKEIKCRPYLQSWIHERQVLNYWLKKILNLKFTLENAYEICFWVSNNKSATSAWWGVGWSVNCYYQWQCSPNIGKLRCCTKASNLQWLVPALVSCQASSILVYCIKVSLINKSNDSSTKDPLDWCTKYLPPIKWQWSSRLGTGSKSICYRNNRTD